MQLSAPRTRRVASTVAAVATAVGLAAVPVLHADAAGTTVTGQAGTSLSIRAVKDAIRPGGPARRLGGRRHRVRTRGTHRRPGGAAARGRWPAGQVARGSLAADGSVAFEVPARRARTTYVVRLVATHHHGPATAKVIVPRSG